MFNWFSNLGPFAQKLISGVVTSLITAGLLALAAAGIYRPAVVNVAAPNVSVSLPEGYTLALPTKPADSPPPLAPK